MLSTPGWYIDKIHNNRTATLWRPLGTYLLWILRSLSTGYALQCVIRSARVGMRMAVCLDTPLGCLDTPHLVVTHGVP